MPRTLSPNPTTNLAICLMLITYLASSVLGLMILVQRATWRAGEGGGSVAAWCAARRRLGG